jgi:hypothetical protein
VEPLSSPRAATERYFSIRFFELVGTPMAIELRTRRNPYAGKAKKGRRWK